MVTVVSLGLTVVLVPACVLATVVLGIVVFVEGVVALVVRRVVVFLTVVGGTNE